MMRVFLRSAAQILCLLLTAMVPVSTSKAQATNPTPPPPPVEQRQLEQFKVKLIPPQNGRSSATENIDTTEANLGSSPADVANLPAIQPAGRPVIGLVLEGGGALGLAHIGVIQWLEENHIPVDRLSGTSMGALVGGLYASGHTVQELKTIATGNVLNTVFTLSTPYTDVSYRRRQDRRDLPQAIQLGLKGSLGLRNSLLIDNALESFLRQQFASYNSHTVDYDQLPIPFRCVATDLNELKPLIFRGGPLPAAIRASISIPGVFAPVEYHHHHLVDGAIMDNLPIDVARQDLQASVVIAVHLTHTPFAESDISSIVGVFASALTAATARNVDQSQKQADILLLPGTDKFTTVDYGKVQQLIDAGYKSAEQQRAQLVRYALSDADWETYLSARRARIRPKPGLLQVLHVEALANAAGVKGAQREVAIDLAPMKQKPINPIEITSGLSRVQADGSYEASFETFSEAGPLPGPVSSESRGPISTPDTGILVRLNPVHNGPPFLLLGGDLSAATSNVTHSEFDFRVIDQNLGGFGSELRADLRIGFLTQASVEYYRLLSSGGWFVQPHLSILREPVYIWHKQKRVSEYFEQQAGGGLDVGRTFSSRLQASLEYRKQQIRWRLTSGDAISKDLSGTSNTAIAHVFYDSTLSGTVSPRGFRLEVSAGSIFNSVASGNAPFLQIHADKSFALRETNLFGVSVDADTYFRHNVADPLRFTLGGPYRLAASSFDEYRATDDYLVRFGYLRRLAALPAGLGHGIYLVNAYEAGEVWTPEQRVFVRQDIFSGFVVDTPLGGITLGGSWGDAGRKKVLLSIGKLF